jgi:hypothetical protein
VDERSRLGALDLEESDTSVRAALDVTHRSLRPELADTVHILGLFPGTRIGAFPVAALCGITRPGSRRAPALRVLREDGVLVVDRFG